MRESARGNGRNLRKIVGSVDLNLIEPAYRDVGKLAGSCMHNVDVIVIGPLSIVLRIEKGGRASKTITRPTSFSVSQTCLPLGVAAISGKTDSPV